MADSSADTELGSLVEKLREEHRRHLDAAAKIESALKKHGISIDKRSRRSRRPGRPKGTVATKAPAAGKRKRGTFRKNAEQFILDLLKKNKTLATADINKRWKQAKRGGTADTTLSKLAATGQITRAKVEGGRGSQYSIA